MRPRGRLEGYILLIEVVTLEPLIYPAFETMPLVSSQFDTVWIAHQSLAS